MDVYKISKKMAQADARLAVGRDFDEKIWCAQTRMEIDHFSNRITNACVQLVYDFEFKNSEIKIRVVENCIYYI